MVHLRTRNDLFKIAEEKPPTPAIGEALSSGSVELLGGFKRIPPSIHSGWIMIVTSKRGTVWNVALTLWEHPDRVAVWIVKRIPWERWLGNVDREPGIHDGDNPRKYEELSARAKTASGYSGS
ncbi:hypothetical protein LCGC14_0594360 [marine sediment metagenome]|uniref:Uncharacterized protein n=1 Tax=marine sediment metagenome TaxID=412755 RepID=A0A0F9RHF9_9ZZZZ